MTPSTDTRGGKLDRALDTIVDSVGHKPVDAAIALHGLHPVIVPGRRGISIDRAEARRKAEEIRLLDRRTLLELFPSAQLWEEKVLGLVKSFVVHRGFAAA